MNTDEKPMAYPRSSAFLSTAHLPFCESCGTVMEIESTKMLDKVKEYA
jgi:hypothetical protein